MQDSKKVRLIAIQTMVYLLVCEKRRAPYSRDLGSEIVDGAKHLSRGCQRSHQTQVYGHVSVSIHERSFALGSFFLPLES